MQEEVTRKTIALAIKTAKLDGKVLQAALRKLLQLYRKARDTPHRGRQTLKQLMRHGTGVSNITALSTPTAVLPRKAVSADDGIYLSELEAAGQFK